MDFPKYEPQTDRHCLDTVFTSLAAGVGKQIKYAQLAKNYSNPTIKKAFDTLQLARLVYKVASVNPPQIPLGASVTDKIFKSVFLDIGLMQLLCGMNTGNEYLKTDLLAIYNGALAEQFVGQELLAAHDFELYFWSRQSKSSLAEVDYVSVIQNNVIPIEVKSGAAGHLRSMHSFLEHYPQSPYGIVLSDREYAELKEQKLKFFPIYFTNSLANQ